MKALSQQADSSFKDFNDARHALREQLTLDLGQKEREIQKLQNETRDVEMQNESHI